MEKYNITNLVKSIVNSFKYPILIKTSIITTILTITTAISVALQGHAIKRMLLIIISNLCALFVTLCCYFNVDMSEAELEEVTDALHSVIQGVAVTNRDKLLAAKSRVDAIRIHRELDMQNEILLPNVTLEEVLEHKHRYLNAWIFRYYTLEFLTVWWDTTPDKIEHLFQFMNIGKGMTYCESDGEREKIKQTKDRYDRVWMSRVMPDMERQSVDPVDLFKLLRNLACKVLGVLLTLAATTIIGQKFASRDLFSGMSFGNEMNNLTTVFTDELIQLISDSDPKTLILNEIAERSKSLNSYLETPTHVFAASPHKLSAFRDYLVGTENFIRGIPREFSALAVPLQGLYQAANVRKNDIFTSELPNYARQEPFVILLQGPGGVGKTHLARNMARKVVNSLIADGEMAKDYIEITPSDKYWPPLSGQRVALFDEAGTVRDYKEDLLMSNIKGICSPTFFNCAAADIPHKISPAQFQVIFATVNTDLIDVCGRIAETSSAESVWPCFRRMLVFKCEWNEEKAGVYNYNGSNRYDEDYSHLKIRPVIWNSDQQMPVTEMAPPISFENLYGRIQKRFKHMESDHVARINLAVSEKQSAAGKNHYTVNLNGPGGHGKTPISAIVVEKLASAYRMPIIKLRTIRDIQELAPLKERAIVLCDDLVQNIIGPELEEALMLLYNEKLFNNSILLFCTNVTPSYAWLPEPTPFGIAFPRAHPFKNLGLTRRMGYKGNFTDGKTPEYNDEFYVENGCMNVYSTLFVNWRQLLALCMSCFPLYWTYFSLACPLLVLCIIYLRREIPHVTSDALPQYLFDRYNSFLEYRKQLKVVEGVGAPSFAPNFKFWAASSSNIIVPTAIYKLNNHIFLHDAAFEDADLPWKFWMERNLAFKLKSDYKRFICAVDGISDQTIISTIEKYVRTFLELGEEPRMSIEVMDLGKFEYVDGTLYITRPAASNVEVEAKIFGDYVHVNGRMIPLDDVFDVDQLVETFELDLIEAGAISRLIGTKEFYRNPIVCKKLRDKTITYYKTQLQMIAKEHHDRVVHFFTTPLGKVIGIFLAVASCGLLVHTIYNYLCPSANLEQQHKRKIGTKKKANNPRYLSDAEDHAKGKIGSKKKPNPKYLSDEEREDVKTLADMNSYSSYAPLVEQVHPKTRKNLCQVYIVASNVEKLDSEPIGNQSCYGLFVGGKTFVTVRHVVDPLRANPAFQLYVGSDEFSGFYRCVPVRQYNMRELSVWKIPNLPIQFPSMAKAFKKRSDFLGDDEINCAMERLAPGKISQWVQGNMYHYSEPMPTQYGDQIADYGYVDFGVFGLKLTSFGDCGLPYYYVDGAPFNNALAGIHCMGNPEGSSSVGILASIYREDVVAWTQAENQVLVRPQPQIASLQQECTWCNLTDYSISASPTPKVEGHEIVWSPIHDSSPEAFYGECRKYFMVRTNFSGHVIKNSGPIAMGSIEHSHTQFLPGVREDMEITNGWKSGTCGELGISNFRMASSTSCIYRVIDARFPTIFNCLNTVKLVPNFRVYINVYNDNRHLRRATIKIIIVNPTLTIQEISLGALDREAQSPMRLPNDVEVYVSEDVKDIFEIAEYNLHRNILPDVPFETVADNHTVKLIGTLKQSASRLPRPMYKQTPFSKQVCSLIPIEKEPVEYDLSKAPKEITDAMCRNRLGDPDARINQSIQWAHSMVEPDRKFRDYTKSQFISKIYEFYSNLRPLTDKEVFEGYPVGHRYYGYLSPLELDKSIGFTMKQLYHVQHKSDVISKTPEGEYFWREEEAAQFAKTFYESSKAAIGEGKKHYSAFLELLKMEKLKTAKKHIGRTFVAQDLNGVLIERYAMGSFAAKAMKDDPACGVGTNAYDDFQRIYMGLLKFPNMFTGDYKRFDRTTPYCVFQDTCHMLRQVNPHMEKEITSVFSSIMNRIQISGTTVFQCLGGMPSGCTLTAPLNSLNNDYILYSSFAKMAERNFFDPSYISYNKHIFRKFYGDDVIVSVSDEISSWFNMTTLSGEIRELFGMILDSSEKDGTLKTFETFAEASWISRYFRKLDRYPFHVGALKKISIGAHFHYVTSLDPAHMAALFTTAQWEAALWEQAYFDTVHEAIRIAIQKVPAISKHFQFRSRQDIQLELFNNAQSKYAEKQVLRVTEENCLSDSPQRYSTFFERYSFDKGYFRHIIKLCRQLEFDPSLRTVEVENVKYHTSMSFIMQLNEAFQKGIIAKPEISYEVAFGVWECHICIREIHAESKEKFTSKCGTTYIGYGHSKSEAREEAAFKALKNTIPSWYPEFRKVLQTEEQKHLEEENFRRLAQLMRTRELIGIRTGKGTDCKFHLIGSTTPNS